METREEILNKIMDWEYGKKHLFVGVRKYAKDNVLTEKTDLDGIEKYMYIRGDGYTAKITEGYLEHVGIMEADAWSLSKQNTEKETVIRSMASMVSEFLELPELEDECHPLYVLTNECGHFGAGCMVNSSILSKFAKERGVSRLLMLPSSIHEVLLMPLDEDDEVDLGEMSQMVAFINETEVDPAEQLANRAYVIEV